MGECALSRSQFFVSGCILPKTRLFSQREGLFYRRERERERGRGNPIEFEVPVFSMDFLLVDGILRKRKTR